MRGVVVIILSLSFFNIQAQSSIKGKLLDDKNEPVPFANVALYNSADSSMVKVETSDVNGSFNEEYKETLKIQTSENQVGLEDLEFTLPSLKYFFESYNHSTNSTVNNNASIELNTRLGGFVGASNNIYVSNPDNTNLMVAGIDFELMESSLPRHALVVRFKQTFENSDYKFSSSQVSLNYRFKFIKKETFDIFINTKFAAYTNITRDIPVVNDDNSVSIVSDSSGDFQALGNFGIGVDYALGNGYLTFSYNDFLGLGLDNNGEFPLDFTLGYKFNL
ncbi:MAG: carboxypeptidase-like regulatory domain-containing protein [Flavobacteriaceae bacterium]|nr:carboxypeptidase-like regulatory domain-containing protein [Flavobacteriaceae bacterium]